MRAESATPESALAESATAGPAIMPAERGPEIRSRLEFAEQRRRNAARLVRMVIFAGMLCLGGLAAGWVDYLAPLPPFVRWGLLGLTLAITVRSSMRARRLNRRYRISELAARVEAEMPMLEDRLVTAAEIAEGRLPASPAVRARLLNDALADLDRPAVSGTVLKRREYAYGWFVPIVLVILLGLISPEGVGRHALRFALPFLKIAPLTATRLHYSDAYMVLKGDDARIIVEVSGIIPDHATIMLARATDRMEPKPMSFLGFTPAGRAEFSYVVAKPAASFTCQVAAGDAVSFPITVQVIERPRLDDAIMQISPPRYLGRAVETMAPGPVRIHQGSTLTWSGNTVPDGVGWLLLYQQEDGLRETIGEGSGPELQVAYRPRTAGKWTMILANDYGVRVRPWAEVPVELIPDLPPTVDIIQPPVDMLLPPSATVRLAVRAADDFGLTAVRIIAKVNNGDSRALLAWSSGDTNVTSHALEHELPLRELGVQPGDIISWRGWAADGNDSPPGGQTGMSFERFILVVPEGFVTDQPGSNNPRMTAALDELFALIEEQTALLRRTEALSRQAEPAAVDSVRLQSVQARLRARAAALTDQLNELGREIDVAGRMALEVMLAAGMMNQAEGQLGANQPGAAVNPEREALRHLNRALQFIRLSRNENSRMQRNHELGTEPRPGAGSSEKPGAPGSGQVGRSGRPRPGGTEPGADGDAARLDRLAEAARNLADRLGRGRRGGTSPALSASEESVLRAELNAMLNEIESISGSGRPRPNAEIERARQLMRELRPPGRELDLHYAPSGAIIRHLEEVAALLTRANSISIGSRQATGGSDPAPAEQVPQEYRPLVRDYYWRLSQ